MAQPIRFKLEHKDVEWSGKNKKGDDSMLLGLKGHELVTNKFVSAYAWEIMSAPLRVNACYEAKWGKPMEHSGEKRFMLWNFNPILDHEPAPLEDEDNPLIEPKTQPTMPIQEAPTYEEVKAKLLQAIGEFLDMCYTDYHLGQKK